MVNWLNRIIDRYGERNVEEAIGIAVFAGLFVLCMAILAAKAVQ